MPTPAIRTKSTTRRSSPSISRSATSCQPTIWSPACGVRPSRRPRPPPDSQSMKTFLGASLLSVAALSPAAAQTVKTGVLTRTCAGPPPVFAENVERGFSLYMKRNADKLPPGVTVELVIRDDTGPQPDKAKQLAQELIVRDKVQLLTGMMWTPNALAIAPLATEAKIPTVIMNAAASVVTTRSPYFARVSYTEWQHAYPLGQWAAKKYKRASQLVADFAPGHD